MEIKGVVYIVTPHVTPTRANIHTDVLSNVNRRQKPIKLTVWAMSDYTFHAEHNGDLIRLILKKYLQSQAIFRATKLPSFEAVMNIIPRLLL